MSSLKEDIENAKSNADPYHGQGTIYLHTPTPNNEDYKMSNPTGAVVPPISLATTFQQYAPGVSTLSHDPNSFGKGYEYSRTGNPTRGEFERAIAAAEYTKYCVSFSSGSAATSSVIHLLNSGDHVVCIDDVYGGTQRYFRKIVTPSMGITFDFVDFTLDDDIIKEKLKNAKLVWLESPTNPTLKVTDIKKISKLIRECNNNCILAVDNTFCSPYFQNPIKLGADIIVHSVTKYINGHSDVVMGVVCCDDDEIYNKLRFIQNGIGAVPSPFDCYLALRGLKTLHLRMEASCNNAKAIALFLENHETVKKVLYPGLKSHPQYELVKEQQHGPGSMITFFCKGGKEQSAIILQNLKIFALAESLGAVESLAECPSLMTHASVPDEQRKILGIDDTLIRLSVGVESCNDLINDLDQALNASLDSMK